MTLSGLLVVTVLAAPARTCPPPAPEKPVKVIARCKPGTRAHELAGRALDALSARIDRLKDDPADLPGVRDDLERLLTSPCFVIGVENPRPPTLAEAVPLRTWWADGGKAWLRAYLDAPDTGSKRPRIYVVVPPDVRPEAGATSETADIAALVCPGDEPACGLETLGWQARIEQTFQEAPPGEMSRAWDLDQATGARCAAQAGRGSRAYERWRKCIESARRLTAALPLGRYRSPDRGWFVIGGRRGHHAFCDEIRAYDLATGRLLGARRCCEMKPQPSGKWERQDRTLVLDGGVPVENLREAVWMTILARHVEAVQVHAEYFLLPEGMRVGWPVPEQGSGESLLGGGWGGSGQTTLVWAWLDVDGITLAHGELTWPRCDRPGEDLAARLLDVAETAYSPADRAKPLPPWLEGAALDLYRRAERPDPEVPKAFTEALHSLAGSGRPDGEHR